MSLHKKVILGFALSGSLLIGACSNGDEASKEAQSENNNIQVFGDVVSENDGCVLQSQFESGDNIVFRMDAIDPNTNEQISKDAKMTVHLSTGEDLEMHHAQHPSGDTDPVPEFWTVMYKVTDDTPTGILNYSVTAETDGKKGEFAPFDVEPSLLTIVDPAEEGTGDAGEK
ncbi:hypothetical protein DVB69_00270 [Sporosarcina sp. BI001-red]|uniref:hypothetical protein n=1 Tax=Sporosarcina sp. BI001-red TaxID=2282866 RepID=UPI000E227091|nr:hypothetical protein [Sporosarcina sp. BI001-red]REB11615.1 hypothetical protein DVB69_00270 [Sporosarcina sp. BI001-red]